MHDSMSPHPLTTPELLELILSFLPLRSLLLSQRTCKQWHNLISTSPTLQTLLYFQSSPRPTTPTTSFTLNPLLTSAFPFLFAPHQAQTAERSPDWDIEYGDLDIPATLDPCLKPFFYSSFHRRPEAFKRKEASWRRMHVSDPPVRTAIWRRTATGPGGLFIGESVTVSGADYGTRGSEESHVRLGVPGSIEDLSDEYVDLKAADGLRMGMLYDYLFYYNCTGSVADGWDVRFRMGRYPLLEEVIERAGKRDWTWGLTGMVCNEEEESDGAEERGEAKMLMELELEFRGGCIVEEDEEYPQFRSEGYRRMSVGPMVPIKEMLWD